MDTLLALACGLADDVSASTSPDGGSTVGLAGSEDVASFVSFDTGSVGSTPDSVVVPVTSVTVGNGISAISPPVPMNVEEVAPMCSVGVATGAVSVGADSLNVTPSHMDPLLYVQSPPPRGMELSLLLLLQANLEVATSPHLK